MGETVAAISVPPGALAAEVTDLVRQTASAAVFHHARRVFLLGSLWARGRGVEPDPELLYLAAMFHDAGFRRFGGDAGPRSGADGAHQARAFLLGHDRSVSEADTVCSAVALCGEPGASRCGPPVTAATAAGAGIDLLGPDADHLGRDAGPSPDVLQAIFAAHPRSDVERHVARALAGGAGRNTTDPGELRAGVLRRLAPGRLLRPCTAPPAVR